MRYAVIVVLVVMLAVGGWYFWQQSWTPQITGVAPFRAHAGETMRLRGSRFASDAPGNIVTFGGKPARVTSAIPGEIQVEVPDVGVETGAEMRVPVRVRVGPRESAPMGPSKRPSGQVVSLLSEADSALAGHDYEKAAGLYAEALKLDPRNTTAEAGRASAFAAAALRRSFVPEITDVGSSKAVTAQLEGFDTREVAVKRAPESFGKLDFEVSPAHVKPGDDYSLKVYLTNGGKKPIRVKDVVFYTTADGQRALVDEVAGVWGEFTSWAVEVRVSSRDGDVYTSRITWK